MQRYSDLEKYTSNLEKRALSRMGDRVDEELSRRRGGRMDVAGHFARALSSLWSEGHDEDFEARSALLIKDLKAMVVSADELDEEYIRVLKYRMFLLKRASFAFRSSLVSTKTNQI
jgi:hypothetical protein